MPVDKKLVTNPRDAHSRDVTPKDAPTKETLPPAPPAPPVANAVEHVHVEHSEAKPTEVKLTNTTPETTMQSANAAPPAPAAPSVQPSTPAKPPAAPTTPAKPPAAPPAPMTPSKPPAAPAKPTKPANVDDDDDKPRRAGLEGGRFLTSNRTPVGLAEMSELKSQVAQRNKMGALRTCAVMLEKVTNPLQRGRVTFGKDVFELSSTEQMEFDKTCSDLMSDMSSVSMDNGSDGINWGSIVQLIQLVLSLLNQFKMPF